MKNVYFTLFIAMALYFISVNLQKEYCETVEVAFGDTIEYNLGFFGDEDRIKVLKHPQYNAFEGFCSKNREPLIYCYTPNKPLKVSDTIFFRKSTGSDGSNPPTEHNIITLIIKPKSD